MASCEHLPFCPTVFGIAVRVRWADNPVRRIDENLAGCPLAPYRADRCCLRGAGALPGRVRAGVDFATVRRLARLAGHEGCVELHKAHRHLT